MTLAISRMELWTRVPTPPVADVLQESIAAVVRYWSIQEHEVWIVFRYVGERNVSRRRVLPCGWLKYTKRDQWMCHVQEWSWVRQLILRMLGGLKGIGSQLPL